MKRSPLKRSTKRIRPMSKKRASLTDDRKALRNRVMERCDGQCEAGKLIAEVDWGLAIGCTGIAQHVHEKLPRSACGSITDDENCVAACGHCHFAIHAKPDMARLIGLKTPRYQGVRDV